MTTVAGIQSASDVEWLQPILASIPGLTFLFNLVAPLLVKILNAMLPSILTKLAMFEGPVSSMDIECSLFTKLSAFQIIQTFFVLAVGGAVTKEIQLIIANPDRVFELLGEALPGMVRLVQVDFRFVSPFLLQSIFFIQVVFVSTVITIVTETLRIIPLAMALIRKRMGPNLTKKERQTAAFGIRPLADVEEFSLADNTGQIVRSTLYKSGTNLTEARSFQVMNFIIMLVYAVIAPMTAYTQGFCFLLLYVSYRHQFVSSLILRLVCR